MSPRARILVIVGAATALAAGATVALAVITANDEGGGEKKVTPLQGVPPLVFDLGVRVDPEARALRRGERLYSQKKRAQAGRIFARYESPAAKVGAAFASWPDDSLADVERLARERPDDSLVLLHLGYAKLWAGDAAGASEAWQKASEAQPDSPSAQRANDALHPNFPPGQPLFVPSFPSPSAIDRLSPPQQFAYLRRQAAGARRARKAPVRAGPPAPRPPDLGAPPVRGRRQARSERPGDRGRGRRRALRQAAPSRSVLPSRPPDETFPARRHGPVPSRAPSPLAEPFAAGLVCRGQAAAAPGSRGRAEFAAQQGSSTPSAQS